MKEKDKYEEMSLEELTYEFEESPEGSDFGIDRTPLTPEQLQNFQRERARRKANQSEL